MQKFKKKQKKKQFVEYNVQMQSVSLLDKLPSQVPQRNTTVRGQGLRELSGMRRLMPGVKTGALTGVASAVEELGTFGSELARLRSWSLQGGVQTGVFDGLLCRPSHY